MKKTVIGAIIIGVGLLTAHECGIVWNASPSMPVGIWRVTAVRSIIRGQVVTLCPSQATAALGLDRGYLDGGECTTGVAPLLKPIAAVPGDTVEVSDVGIAVNGTLLRHSAAMAADDLGRPMQAVPVGTYAVGRGEIWVVSSYDPRSFDSRYYGPVPVENIRGTARPLFISR